MASLGSIRSIWISVRARTSSAERDIDRLNESTDDLVDNFERADDRAERLRSSYDELGTSTAELSDWFGDVSSESSTAQSSLDELGDSSQLTAEEIDQTRRAAENLNTTLPETATDGGEAFRNLNATLGDTRGETTALQRAFENFGNTSLLPRGLAGDAESIQDSLASLGDIRLPSGNAEELVQDLERSRTEALAAADALEVLGEGGDQLIDSADSVGELRRQLRFTDVDGEAFADLSDSAEDFVTAALRGASSVDTFEENIESLGDRATGTASRLVALDESTDGGASSAILASRTFSGLAENVEDVGEEATTTTAKLGVLSTAMRSLPTENLRANLGPLSGRLGTIAKILPALIAGVSGLGGALGGLAVGGAGAGGILYTLALSGGLAAGQMRAAESATDDVGTAMEGLEAILEDTRKQALQALAPLRTAEYAQLFRGGLQEGLDILRSWVSLTQSLSDEVLAATENVAAVWNNEIQAALFDELRTSITAVLPLIERGLIGVLRALPGALRTMRDAAVALGPALFTLTSEFGSMLGPLVEVGANTLSVLMPALSAVTDVASGFLMVLSVLSPALSVLGDVLSFAADAASPLLTALGALAGSAYVAYQSFTIFSALSGIFAPIITSLGGLTGILGSIGGVLTTIGGGISSLVAAAGGASGILGTISTVLTGIAGAATTLVGILGGPLTVALVGLGALVAGVATNAFGLRDALSGLLSPLSELAGFLGGVAGGLLDIAGALGGLAIDIVLAPFQLLADAIVAVGTAIGRTVLAPLSALASLFGDAAGAVSDFFAPFASIPGTLHETADAIRAISPKQILADIIASIPSLLAGLPGLFADVFSLGRYIQLPDIPSPGDLLGDLVSGVEIPLSFNIPDVPSFGDIGDGLFGGVDLPSIQPPSLGGDLLGGLGDISLPSLNIGGLLPGLQDLASVAETVDGAFDSLLAPLRSLPAPLRAAVQFTFPLVRGLNLLGHAADAAGRIFGAAADSTRPFSAAISETGEIVDETAAVINSALSTYVLGPLETLSDTAGGLLETAFAPLRAFLGFVNRGGFLSPLLGDFTVLGAAVDAVTDPLGTFVSLLRWIDSGGFLAPILGDFSAVGSLIDGASAALDGFVGYLEWVNEGGILSPILGDATVLGSVFGAAAATAETLAAGVGVLTTALGTMYDIVSDVVDIGLGILWDYAADSAYRLATGVGFVVGVFTGLYDIGASLVGLGLGVLFDTMGDAAQRLAAGVGVLTDALGTMYDTAADVVSLGLGTLWDYLTASADRLAAGIDVVVGAFQTLYGIAEGAASWAIIGVIDTLAPYAQDAAYAAGVLTGVLRGLLGVGVAVADWGLSAVLSAAGDTMAWLSDQADTVRTVLEGVYDSAADIVDMALSPLVGAFETVESVISDIQSGVSWLIERIPQIPTPDIPDLPSFNIPGLGGGGGGGGPNPEQVRARGHEAGRGMAEGFASGSAAGEGMVKRAAHDLMETVSAYLPSSPADVGPLSTLIEQGAALPGTFATGIQQNSGVVETAAGNLADLVRDALPDDGLTLPEFEMPEMPEMPSLEQTLGISLDAGAMLPDPGAWVSRGEAFVNSLGQGIRNAAGDLQSALSDTLGSLLPFLPSSDARRGPLATLSSRGAALVETLAAGIRSQEGIVQSAIGSVFSGLGDALPDLPTPALPDMPEMPSLGDIGMPSLPDALNAPTLPSVGDIGQTVQDAPQMVQSAMGGPANGVLSGAGPGVSDAVTQIQAAMPSLPSLPTPAPSVQMAPSVTPSVSARMNADVSPPPAPTPRPSGQANLDADRIGRSVGREVSRRQSQQSGDTVITQVVQQANSEEDLRRLLREQDIPQEAIADALSGLIQGMRSGPKAGR